MAKRSDAENGTSPFIHHGGGIETLVEAFAATHALGISLDRLAAIQQTRNAALSAPDAPSRQSARAALHRWKKRRGWKTLLSRKKRATRWMPVS